MAQDITTGIELLFWNEREFYENRVSRANAAAFLLHCGWTAPAGFSATGVLALLIELCKKRFDEDLSEMASETGAGMEPHWTCIRLSSFTALGISSVTSLATVICVPQKDVVITLWSLLILQGVLIQRMLIHYLQREAKENH